MKKLIVLILCLPGLVTLAQEKKSNATISVKGISNLRMKPDEGILNLNASYIGLDINQAMSGLEKKTKELIKQIVASGLNENDVKTTNFQLNKNTVYRRGNTKDSGYFATQSLMVKFVYSKEKVAKILTNFSDSKADYNMHFNFVLSDSLKKKMEVDLMKLAVKDASKKAGVLATESGVRLKAIKSIEYGYAPAEPNYPMYKSRSMMADEGGQQNMQGFTPMDIELSDEVLMVWELE